MKYLQRNRAGQVEHAKKKASIEMSETGIEPEPEFYAADDAARCCRPSVTEGYRCPECAGFHPTETGALNCCRDEGTPPIVAPRELEHAGQMRIIP